MYHVRIFETGPDQGSQIEEWINAQAEDGYFLDTVQFDSSTAYQGRVLIITFSGQPC